MTKTGETYYKSLRKIVGIDAKGANLAPFGRSYIEFPPPFVNYSSKTVKGAKLAPFGPKRVNEWIVDSGCSHHMYPDISVFGDDYKEMDKKRVFVADGKGIPIAGIGTVTVKIFQGTGVEPVELRLKNVLCVPTLKRGLLSVGRGRREGTKFDFDTHVDKVVVKIENLKLTSESTDRSGLYAFKVINTRASAYAVLATPTLDLWHERTSHYNYESLRRLALAKDPAVKGIEVPKGECERMGHVCDSCEIGCKKRTSFGPSRKQDASACNSRANGDIAGPMEVVTWLLCAAYVCLFVDAHSRYCHVKLVKEKSDTLGCFKEYVIQAENRHNTPLVAFHSDGGGEFISKDFSDYVKMKGIHHGKTTAATPEQNSMAEIRFRSLFAKVRVLLLAAGLPKEFWGEALECVVYVMNRLPNSATKISPFERWFKYKPDLAHLRTFGCLCYVYVPKDVGNGTSAKKKRRKLDVRSIRCIFLGYATNQFGYKCLDCTTGKIIVSIHVTFDETKSIASMDLKQQELLKLSKLKKLDFNFYSRQAVSDEDYMFYAGDPVEDKASLKDLELLEQFVDDYDM